MTADQVVAAFVALGPERQVRVLAAFAHRGRINARGTDVPGTEDIADPRRLRMLNDVQHRMTGHIRQLRTSDAMRYTDDALARIAIAEDDCELISNIAEVLGRC